DIARHRSIATYLNGPAGMRELGLRPALPWFPALVIPANLLLHGAATVSPRVRVAVERRGDRRIRRQIARYSRGAVTPLVCVPALSPGARTRAARCARAGRTVPPRTGGTRRTGRRRGPLRARPGRARARRPPRCPTAPPGPAPSTGRAGAVGSFAV